MIPGIEILLFILAWAGIVLFLAWFSASVWWRPWNNKQEMNADVLYSYCGTTVYKDDSKRFQTKFEMEPVRDPPYQPFDD